MAQQHCVELSDHLSSCIPLVELLVGRVRVGFWQLHDRLLVVVVYTNLFILISKPRIGQIQNNTSFFCRREPVHQRSATTGGQLSAGKWLHVYLGPFVTQNSLPILLPKKSIVRRDVEQWYYCTAIKRASLGEKRSARCSLPHEDLQCKNKGADYHE